MNKNYQVSVTGEGNILNISEYMSNVSSMVHQNVGKANVPEDARAAVKNLMERVQEASSSIEPELAKQMADDVRTLSDELTRPQPRKAWYEVSLNGLKEAAEAIGKIGEPILSIVANLFPILLGKAIGSS